MGQTAQQIKKAICDQIATHPPKAIEPARIYGVEGYLFKLSSAAWEDWRRIARDDDPQKNRLSMGKLVQMSFRDEEGNLVFDDLNVPLIAGIDVDQIQPIYDRCMQINGYGLEGGEILLKNLLKTLGSDGLYALLGSTGYQCPACSKSTAPVSCENNGSVKSTGRPAEPPTI